MTILQGKTQLRKSLADLKLQLDPDDFADLLLWAESEIRSLQDSLALQEPDEEQDQQDDEKDER